MKYIGQLGIIMGVILVGEGLHAFLPFPVPTSIYGLVLLFIALLTGLIKLEWIEATADWLVGVMPITFLPASVMLIKDWPVLKPFLIPLVIMCVVSTIVIFAASGIGTQTIIKLREKKEDKKDA